MQIDHSCHKGAVTEQLADREDVDSGFQESRRVGMPQRMRGNLGFDDPGFGGRYLASLLNRSTRERDSPGLARKEVAGRAGQFPVRSEFRQQPRRDGHEPVFAPFSGANVDHPPGAVDVAYFEMGGLAQPHF